jgi:hypothetical protein
MENKPIMATSPKEVEFKSKAEDAANIVIEQLNKKKWAIIKQKLKEKSKLNLIKDLKLQRFKKIMVEMHPDKEVFYYDNKTLKGARLVTFLKPTEPELNDKEFKTKLLYF